MPTRVDPIGPEIYRISTYVEELDLQFNQFLIRDEEPLLFHTGLKQHFPSTLEGVMEGYCPPHYPDMRAAVDAVCERKFGPGGPFHPDTPGPWKDSAKVRSAAQVHDERFKECIALQAQYVYDTFGKFPGTVPSMFLIMYLQAHHIDLEFYDEFYKPGAYLKTHAEHMARWHA